ncbi:hypothetical protein cypCar_00003222 [Cyprinus carpio]|nr:hypothetical protein cypCar_00003222 [Cyprinus carpio]
MIVETDWRTKGSSRF